MRIPKVNQQLLRVGKLTKCITFSCLLGEISQTLWENITFTKGESNEENQINHSASDRKRI